MMKKGRLKLEQRNRRINQLLRFIFTFRYATRKQLDMLVKFDTNLVSSQWSIKRVLKEGLIANYYEPSFNKKIYYLTEKGKKFIRLDEAYIKDYHFEKRYAGINTFEHHNMLVDTYFFLKSHIDIERWICEWVLRIGRDRRDKVPDGLVVFPGGLRIALEVETSYKSLDAWKTVVELYRYDVEDTSTYHGVLVVAPSRADYEGIKDKLCNIDPELCDKKFILADLSMLELGTCFYHGKQIHLEEAVKLLKEEVQNHG